MSELLQLSTTTGTMPNVGAVLLVVLLLVPLLQLLVPLLQLPQLPVPLLQLPVPLLQLPVPLLQLPVPESYQHCTDTIPNIEQ